jgi:hypothetical protein
LIRALEREDLPSVVSLFEFRMGSGSRTPPPGLAALFERTLLDQPWADPEIPSLVYIDQQEVIVGFIGSQVRHMRFDGRPVRMACGSHLIADPRAQAPVGALLMRTFLNGQQDLTITDTGTGYVQQMWEALGGQPRHLHGTEWIRVFRPWRFASEVFALRRRKAPPGPVLRGASFALDSLTAPLATSLLGANEVGLRDRPLTPQALLEALPTVVEPLRLYPDYNQSYLDWLFAELSRVQNGGEFIRSVVDGHGSVIGWYIYLLRPGGVSTVVQVVARNGHAPQVLDHLFTDAQSKGAAALRGRVELALLHPLLQRRCVLRYVGGTLVHSRERAILEAIASGSAMLTPLEGEWVGLP